MKWKALALVAVMTCVGTTAFARIAPNEAIFDGIKTGNSLDYIKKLQKF